MRLCFTISIFLLLAALTHNDLGLKKLHTQTLTCGSTSMMHIRPRFSTSSMASMLVPYSWPLLSPYSTNLNTEIHSHWHTYGEVFELNRAQIELNRIDLNLNNGSKEREAYLWLQTMYSNSSLVTKWYSRPVCSPSFSGRVVSAETQ